ncbi:TonB-dependent receptor [uncultured Algibacter sp.]|uniref:SusC/RagA family TonB-linked outer membrane protein n=1 Tax=uncultured Algibacter sp. TaxID=298659 RepID=UPI0032170164
MEINLTKAFFYFRKKLLKIIMRTFILLFCFTTFGFTPNNVLSQNTKIKISKDKIVTVDEVFKIIKEQTKYHFIYESGMFDNFPKVKLKKGIVKANNLLKISLSKGSFNFDLSNGNTIVIVENLNNLQDRPITGTVIDENGIPLAGITVYVTNKKPIGDNVDKNTIIRYAVTDFDGSFSTNVGTNKYLVFDGLSYETTILEVTLNKTVYNAILKEKATSLNEVLVVGYGSTVKKDLTGSVGSIKADDITKINRQSIDQALAGQVPGVFVQGLGGAPGAGATVFIRGLTQLRGDNQPLYVIDGVPITVNNQFLNPDGLNSFGQNENPLLAINPQDIERIDILKDASSSAIYGSRAANGVILITTKKGKRNQEPTLTFSQNTTFQEATGTHNLLNAIQFKDFAIEQAQIAIDRFQGPPFAIPFALPIENAIVNDTDNYFGNADTNWQEAIQNNNPIWTDYRLNLSGGTKHINYRLAVGTSNQEGLIKGSKFTRYNVSANIDANVSKRISVGTSIGYNYTVNKRSGLIGLSNAFFRPDLPIFNEDGSFSSTTGRFGIVNRNPLGDQNKVRNRALTQNILASGHIGIKIIKNLKFKSLLSVNTNSTQSSIFSPSFTMTAQRETNFSGIIGAVLENQFNTSNSFSFSNTLNYVARINKNHRIDALLGIESFSSRIDLEAQEYQGFPDDKTLTSVNSAQNVNSYSSQSSQNGLNSILTRINYNYKDRYLLTLTGRRDKSTKFGPNNKVGYFPSTGVAWNIHNENFLKENNLINQLKIRASLGRVGNSGNIPSFSYQSFLTTPFNGQGIYNGLNGIAINGLPAPDLKWETTDQLDLGLEFQLFKSRFNAEISYFKNKTKDLILFLPVPAQTGFLNRPENIGDVTNKGWEILIGGDLIRTKNFNWNSSLNISFVKNNVDKLNGGATIPATGGTPFIEEGSPIGAIFGVEVSSIAQTQQEIDELNAAAVAANSPFGGYSFALIEPGDYIYKDTNGDGFVTGLDRKTLGDINPDYFGGWNNTMTYKSFDFSFNFQFVQGNERIWQRAVSLGGVNLSENTTDIIYNTWTEENRDARYANIGSRSHGSIVDPTSRAVVDGSYIRLRSAALGFRFPKKWIDHMGINSAKLSFSGNNLFTITDYPGIDPEAVNTPRGGSTVDLTIDNDSSYPQVKTYTLGLNVTF